MISGVDLCEFSLCLMAFSLALAMTTIWLLSKDQPIEYPFDDESESDSDDDYSE